MFVWPSCPGMGFGGSLSKMRSLDSSLTDGVALERSRVDWPGWTAWGLL